jgi:HD-GYP domain-containing protein (c-di-GMP phosphodiesterase class II)
MRKHPFYAYEMLNPIAYLRPALDIPFSHHEKWDGSGYPKGLKGEKIPLAARIFSVVDVWDALCSDRPYRKGSDFIEVINYIKEHSEVSFDPKVVDVFIDLIEKGEFGDRYMGNNGK